MSKRILSIALITGIISFQSCKKADPPVTSETPTEVDYSNGVLISNEGAFGSSNGSISQYNPLNNSVTNNIFNSINNRPLGDVVQSVKRYNGLAYICVNNSNKVEVVDGTSFKEIATVTGVDQPRYMTANGNTGYISSWNNNGEIAILDLATNLISGTIQVGEGPEKMAIANNYLYVANSGGFGVDSTISVIDLTTNTLKTTITLTAYNPSTVIKGSDNNIWVLAKGRTLFDANWNVIGEDPSKLFKINSTTNTIESTTNLFSNDHPNSMDISPDGSTLYVGGSFGFKAIYSINTTTPKTPTTPFINEANYGFFVNSSNGNIFILQEASAANGKLLRYNASATKLGEYTVGIFPNGGSKRNKK